MDRRSASLAARALLALVLMIGFYIVALGIAFLLLFLPYAEFVYGNRLHPKLAFFCLVGAAVILWSIMPRWDRFVPPGPALEAGSQPRLFELIRGVAGATRQDMPSEVYLVIDLNASVAQRGGIMGFGSRRVMGLGLPLLQVLTTSELRAVLSHEFGHYHGGDTRLGPWIYKTRGAIARTLQGLAGHSSMLQKPFLWYGKMFMRVTLAVSRRQELSADALAARTVGARPLMDGLRKIHGAALAMGAYLSTEVSPVLSAGFLPPFADGFERFMSSEPINRSVSGEVDRVMKEAKSNPYDTHPPLPERIAALQGLPAGEPPHEDPPAFTLVAEIQALERQLLAPIAERNAIRDLKPIRWEEVGERVYLPQWAEVVRGKAEHFGSLTVSTLPAKAHDVALAIGRDVAPAGAVFPDEDLIRRGAWFIAAVLALALARSGWSIRALVGEPILLTRGSDTVDTFASASALASGQMTAETWQRQCAELAIADFPLGAPAG